MVVPSFTFLKQKTKNRAVELVFFFFAPYPSCCFAFEPSSSGVHTHLVQYGLTAAAVHTDSLLTPNESDRSLFVVASCGVALRKNVHSVNPWLPCRTPAAGGGCATREPWWRRTPISCATASRAVSASFIGLRARGL